MESSGPTCIKCGGVAFDDMPYRLPRSHVLVNLVACVQCGGVVGVLRNINAADQVGNLSRPNWVAAGDVPVRPK